jgi:hypothetical protein
VVVVQTAQAGRPVDWFTNATAGFAEDRDRVANCRTNEHTETARLGLAANGYNIGKSNPFKSSGDPGFTGMRVFDYTCTSCVCDISKTAICSGGYYNYVDVISDFNCQSDMSSESITTYGNYVKERGSSLSQGLGFSFEASFGGFGVSAEASASFSTQSDSDEQKVLKLFQEEQGEIIISKAKCLTHDITFSYQYVRPYFDPIFVAALESLDSSLSKDENGQLEAYRLFVQTFGTHFVQKAQYGASLHYMRLFKKRSQSEAESIKRNSCFASAAEGCVGGGYSGTVEVSAKACIDANFKECANSNDESESGSTSSTESIRIISRGSRPTSLDKWIGDDFTPVPIELNLVEYKELITDAYVTQSVEYGFQKTLNAAGIRALLEKGNSRYCELILGKTQDECQATLKGCGINDNCTPGQECQNALNEQGFNCVELPPTTTTTSAPTTCQKFHGDRYFGGLYENTVASETECWSNCLTNPACYAVTYSHDWTLNCFYFGKSFAKGYDGTFTSYRCRTKDVPCIIKLRTAYTGHYERTWSSSQRMTSCIESCVSDSRCAAVTVGGGYCHKYGTGFQDAPYDTNSDVYNSAVCPK